MTASPFNAHQSEIKFLKSHIPHIIILHPHHSAAYRILHFNVSVYFPKPVLHTKLDLLGG